MTYKQTLTRYVRSFLSALKDYGVEHIVVSPGSRSTPLAYGVVSDPDFKVSIQVDERSAGFYALGIAKALEKPVVLVCTSGSAAANYFPAIVEAYYARIPLIVVTADRPHELRQVGAPQTIDQVKLYGDHVKWMFDYPLADSYEATEPFVYQQTVRVVAESLQAPKGPVHVNIPFREPLLIDLEVKPDKKVTKAIRYPEQRLAERDKTELTCLINESNRGIVVVGEFTSTNRDAVEDFLTRLGWPILCDPLSNLRTTKNHLLHQLLIENYDGMLKNKECYEALKPDTIIRIGAQPVSKFLGIFLKESAPRVVISIDFSARFRDSLGLTTDLVIGDAASLQEIEVTQAFEHQTITKWTTWNQQVRDLIKLYKEQQSDEGAYVATLLEHLPEDSLLFASSSMPIRDVDTFLQAKPSGVHVFANRGTNGIDGVASTALGAQKAAQRPLVLLIGDLAMLHDANALLLSRYQHVEGTIVVMNNDGGGIFSYLPQATIPEHYETLFGTASGLKFDKLAEMYGLSYTPVTSKKHLAELIVQPTQGLRILEVSTHRPTNTETHRELWKQVAESWNSHDK